MARKRSRSCGQTSGAASSACPRLAVPAPRRHGSSRPAPRPGCARAAPADPRRPSDGVPRASPDCRARAAPAPAAGPPRCRARGPAPAAARALRRSPPDRVRLGRLVERHPGAPVAVTRDDPGVGGRLAGERALAHPGAAVDDDRPAWLGRQRRDQQADIVGAAETAVGLLRLAPASPWDAEAVARPYAAEPQAVRR